MRRGGDGAPPARSAAAAAARLPTPGVKGRGDGAAWESCVLVFWGAAGKGGEAVGTSHMPDTRIRMPATPRRSQPRETLGEKLKSSGGSRQPGPCRAGSGRILAAAPSGKAARGTCGTCTYFANAGLSRDKTGSWQVLGCECVFLFLAEELGWTVRRCWDETRLCVASAWGQEWGRLRLGPVLPGHWL